MTTAYAVETVRIMPLGDSITYDGYSTHDSAYRGPLWTKLSTDGGYNIDFGGRVEQGINYRDIIDSTFILNHEGYDGWNAAQIATNVAGFL
ncbi:MAG: hypothetical protein U9Q12_02235, partial [Patescibacteria group bacterium]|nr:hypothetical protein [Patescibacteria group bacterium]